MFYAAFLARSLLKKRDLVGKYDKVVIHVGGNDARLRLSDVTRINVGVYICTTQFRLGPSLV